MCMWKLNVWNKLINPIQEKNVFSLESVFCKKRQKKSKPRNWFGEYGTSEGLDPEGFEWYQSGPKWAWVTLLII